MFDDFSQLPINQTARALYYADEALVAIVHSRGSKLKEVDPVHILRSRVAFEVSKQKLNSGAVEYPYGFKG